MGVLGSVALQKLYERHAQTELVYSAQVADSLGLVNAQSTLKFKGLELPCRLHAATFQSARVLLTLPEAKMAALSAESNQALLRLVFQGAGVAGRETFLLSGPIAITQVRKNPGGILILLLNLTFTNRPGDGFIELQGNFLDMQSEATKRREERIPLNEQTQALLGLQDLQTLVHVEQVPRKCVLRELSFGGARVVLTGLAPYLHDKHLVLDLHFAEAGKLSLAGKIVHAEDLGEHKGLVVLGIQFDEEKIPVAYVEHLHKTFRRGLDKLSGRH